MTATAHALMGAAIATGVSNPVIGLPLSFFSHLLGDKIPHWDAMTEKNKPFNRVLVETTIDVILGYILVAIVFLGWIHVQNPLYIFVSAWVAQLPDWLEFPYSVFKLKIPFVYDNYRLQSWVHHVWFDSRLKAPWGVVTQVVVVGIFVLLALRSTLP